MSALEGSGVRLLMMAGTHEKQKWFADNLDTVINVSMNTTPLAIAMI